MRGRRALSIPWPGARRQAQRRRRGPPATSSKRRWRSPARPSCWSTRPACANRRTRSRRSESRAAAPRPPRRRQFPPSGRPPAPPGPAPPPPPKAICPPPPADADIAVSAKTGLGVESLARLLIQHSASLLAAEGEVALNRRHRAALQQPLAALGDPDFGDLLIRAEASRQARSARGRLSGRAAVEDMLDSLFGRFCIGK